MENTRISFAMCRHERSFYIFECRFLLCSKNIEYRLGRMEKMLCFYHPGNIQTAQKNDPHEIRMRNNHRRMAMSPLDTILNHYESADETERLHLFLSHRDLREAFMQIEMSQGPKVRTQSSTESGWRWKNRLLQCCGSLVKS